MSDDNNGGSTKVTSTSSATKPSLGAPNSVMKLRAAKSVLGATSALGSGVAGGLSTVSTLVLGPNELNHAQLQSIEKRRRAILLRSELPFYKMLTYWDGTCLKILALDPLMWLTMILYVIIRVMSRTGLPDYVEALSSGNIGVLGTFLSFFLVFFVNNSNTRFNAQYGLSMAAKGRILDIASIARGTLPKERGLRIVRYLNASVSYDMLCEMDVSISLHCAHQPFMPRRMSLLILTPPARCSILRSVGCVQQGQSL
jgi:hypothetical protein